MEKEQAFLTILFADISKSTRIYEILGNKVAQELITNILSQLSDVTHKHGGTVIKTIGDAVLCTFPDAPCGLNAAKEMHESMERVPAPPKPGIGPLNIYVGLHAGPVILQDGDVFGDAVNVASRMVSMAKPRQILTTEETIQMLSSEQRACAKCVDKTGIKGKTGEIRIYEFIWERQDQTVMVDSLLESQTFRFRMELRLRDQVIVVDQNRPSATLGRQSHNDLVVDDSRVSRSHARIEYRRGRFMLVDQSSNGTFVAPKGGKGSKIKREEAPLTGEGVIALGKVPDPESQDVIHFAVKS